MTAAPYLLGRRGPGAAIVAGGGSGATDGGFVSDPIVTTTASGNTTVKGQVKPGSFGKFVYPLATIAAGRQYTFRYTPQFSQLAQQGKLAMVGFGLKNNNDFHIVGLRGDGSSGLHKYKVNGTPPNGWNKQTGHTESDGGAAANGTQAGPNYIRLVVSADGATYKFQTSPNGSAWTDEYTGQTPTPFSNVSGVLTFGIALWFNNADAGPFSIVIDQFADVVAPVTDPYFANVVLLYSGAADDSLSAHTPTLLGNAQLDSGDLLLDGSGDYARFADSADWFFGTGAFVVEGFFTFAATPTNCALIGQWAASNTWLFAFEGGALSFRDGNAHYSSNTAFSPTLGTRYHLMAERDASAVMRIFVNGVMLGGARTGYNYTLPDTADTLAIGSILNAGVSGFDMNGRVRDARITKGQFRCGSDAGFTVPALPLPRS